jgi:hypothetical protein
LDAAQALHSILQAYQCQCDYADADDPAHFMSFVLQRLHIETSWGPEEYPFRDQDACPAEIEGSALRNIFGGTLLLSYNLKRQVNRQWLLQPFEMLRVGLPSQSTAVLQTLIGSANRCIGNDDMEFQIDGLCGAPPVLIVQMERCLQNKTCCVSYGMELPIPTKNPVGSVADVTYDLLGAIFQGPETQELRSGDRVQIHGLQTAVHLNGQTGILESWIDSRQRWQVQLEDGGKGNLKLQNLALQDRTAESTKGSTYAAVHNGQQWSWIREATVESALWEDVASRQTEIRLAIYVRRDCPFIGMHPPSDDIMEFWMAQAPDS